MISLINEDDYFDSLIKNKSDIQYYGELIEIIGNDQYSEQNKFRLLNYVWEDFVDELPDFKAMFIQRLEDCQGEVYRDYIESLHENSTIIQHWTIITGKPIDPKVKQYILDIFKRWNPKHD